MHAPRSLGAFGVTAVLGLFGASGVMRACAPAPAPVGAPMNVATECTSMVNAQRAARGLTPVTVDARLNNAAVWQSTDQAKRNKMSHVGSDGSTAGQRITFWGYQWGTWAENVAAGQGNCTSVMSAWMNSSGHRKNILNPSMRNIGMGAVASSNGTIYWTMDLAA